MDLIPPDGQHPEDARIDESFALHKLLTDDLMLVTDDGIKGDQSARRAYVRTAFALMDGMTFRMKATALKVGGAALEPGERMFLEERDYQLSESGGVKSRKARLNTLANIRFTFAMLVRTGQSEWAPSYDGTGWEAMKASIAVRDRLTHPKSVQDLHVTDEQFRDASRAVTWFNSSLIKVFLGIAAAQAKRAGRAFIEPDLYREHAEHIERSVK